MTDFLTKNKYQLYLKYCKFVKISQYFPVIRMGLLYWK